MNELSSSIIDILKDWGASSQSAEIIRSLIIILGIILFSIITNFITKKVIIVIVAKLIKKSKNKYDDIYLEKKVFNLLSHIVPAMIIYFSMQFAFNPKIEYPFDYTYFLALVEALCYIYMIIIVLLVINSFIDASHEVYKQQEISKSVAIKGYLQVIKIILLLIAIILVISVLLDKKPGAIFAGLGALAAVLMLIFKDTILGFVASIQLQAYKMVKPGDWITMPSRGADGDVIDISINTVKVQNFDKTISSIPTYALVSESFTNWKGMQDAGGRRIKRAINLDMKSIKFCTPQMLEKFKKIKVLKDYIEEKTVELKKYNQENNIDESVLVNGRRLTNIGTFRKYLELYLKENEKIHKNYTFLIRQLKPTEVGVAIEIYVFTKTVKWAEYEAIQADIFDHILAIVPEFELNVFQNPTGEDFKKLVN